MAAECGFFGDEPLLLVLLVAIELVFGNFGSLNRIALCIDVATVDLMETSLYSAHLYEMLTRFQSFDFIFTNGRSQGVDVTLEKMGPL